MDPTKAYYLGLLEGIMWDESFKMSLEQIIDEKKMARKK
jgi:hypothetical protein